MTRRYDVVIAGDIYCDLIFTGLPHLPEHGEEVYATGFDMIPGGVYTTVVALRRLGLDVGLYSHLGDDPFSGFILDSLKAEDIDLSLVRHLDYPLRSISVAASFEHDRSFISFADPRPTEPSPYQALKDQPFRHVHIHWLGQLWDDPELIDLARGQGASVSLDCQCCPDVMVRPDVSERIRLVDVFMPNQREAQQITGKDEPEEALSVLARWVPTVIVKLGKQGAIAVHEGKHYSFPALPVTAIDTTGAGDAFAAGLMFGLLSGMNFEDTMLAATICGSLSTTARGGSTRVPRLPELHEWMYKLQSATQAGTNP